LFLYHLLQIPPHELNTLLLAKLPQILDTLFAKIEVLHVRRVLRRRFANSAGNNNRVCLQYYSIVHDFVYRQCNQVVVVVDRALVCAVPKAMLVMVGAWVVATQTYLSSILSESLSASTTLYSKISFSSGFPTT